MAMKPENPHVLVNRNHIGVRVAMEKSNYIDPETEHSIHMFVARAARKYAVAGAIFFGSRARHDFRSDSDADIAVLLHGRRHRFLDVKLELADIAYDVLLETDVLVQPLPIWEDEREHPELSSAPALLRNIEREGIRL